MDSRPKPHRNHSRQFDGWLFARHTHRTPPRFVPLPVRNSLRSQPCRSRRWHQHLLRLREANDAEDSRNP